METGWTEEKEIDETRCACFLSFAAPSFPFLPPGQRFACVSGRAGVRIRENWSPKSSPPPPPISPLAHLPRGTPPLSLG